MTEGMAGSSIAYMRGKKRRQYIRQGAQESTARNIERLIEELKKHDMTTKEIGEMFNMSESRVNSLIMIATTAKNSLIWEYKSGVHTAYAWGDDGRDV